jgi:SNF family Na+-dependent transporter
MSDKNKPQEEIKEYADGWITERKGTDVPMFLKVAYIFIIGGAVTYFIIFMNGEVNHSERGVLVQAFNAVTQSSPGLMYAIAAIIAIYFIIVISFVFRKFHED